MFKVDAVDSKDGARFCRSRNWLNKHCEYLAPINPSMELNLNSFNAGGILAAARLAHWKNASSYKHGREYSNAVRAVDNILKGIGTLQDRIDKVRELQGLMRLAFLEGGENATRNYISHIEDCGV